MNRVSRYLAYLYLLRVPLLTWLFLLGLAPLSVWGAAPLGPALRGLFDLAPPPSSDLDTRVMLLRIFFAFGVVALQALMAATAVGVTARLIVLDGAERFKVAVVDNSPGIRLLFRVLPGAAAIVLVTGAWSQSWTPEWRRIATMAGGTAAGVALFWALSTRVQTWCLGPLQARAAPPVMRQWIGSRHLEGYTTVDAEGRTRVRDRHLHALFQASSRWWFMGCCSW